MMVGISLDLLVEITKRDQLIIEVPYNQGIFFNFITDLPVVFLQLIDTPLYLFIGRNGLFLLQLHIPVNSEVVFGEMVDSNGLKHLCFLPFILTVLYLEMLIVLSQSSLHISNGGSLLFQPLEFVTQIFVFTLQLLYLLMDLLDLDVILNIALQFFEFVHQINLSLFLQLQDATDVFLLSVLFHDQEQHQLHQLRHVFDLEQVLAVGSLDPQILHFHEISFYLKEVALIVELFVGYLKEIGDIDALKQRWQQT